MLHQHVNSKKRKRTEEKSEKKVETEVIIDEYGEDQQQKLLQELKQAQQERELIWKELHKKRQLQQQTQQELKKVEVALSLIGDTNGRQAEKETLQFVRDLLYQGILTPNSFFRAPPTPILAPLTPEEILRLMTSPDSSYIYSARPKRGSA